MRKFLASAVAMACAFSMIAPTAAQAYDNQNYAVYFTGQAHLDTIWLWDEPDTVSYMISTTENALTVLDNDPDYKFTFPASYHYDLLRMYRPDLLERVKGYIQQGRWEAVGGLYVEGDANIPGGENAIRQILYGKQLAADLLNAPESRVAYMPDTFGHPSSFPQIYKKSGFDVYYETKNDQVGGKKIVLPMFFNWQSFDGSSIPCFDAFSYTLSSVSAGDLNAIMNRMQQVPTISGNKINDAPRTFGSGDRGGGPNLALVSSLKALASPSLPAIKFSTLAEYYNVVKSKVSDLAFNWDDELYMESRQGVFSNDAAGKYLLRRNETRAEQTEKFAAAANWLGSADYQYDKITNAYKLLERDSFHDCCYGTHMTNIAVDRHISEHGLIANMFDNSLTNSLNGIASDINTSSMGGGVPLAVFNALSYVRNDTAQATVTFDSEPAYVKVYDAVTNAEVLSQITERDGNAVKLIFEANGVPSVGYKLYRAVASDTPSALTSSLSASGGTLENGALKAVINPATGNISSLITKSDGWEAVMPGKEMNELQFIVDTNVARDLTQSEIKGPYTALNAVDSVRLVENGPVRSVYEVTKTTPTGGSTFTVDYVLYSNSDRLDIVDKANWDELHKMVKAAFNMNTYSDTCTYEQPYGIAVRNITSTDPADTTRFEVPGHEWADISGGGHGVSILNNSKYGWDTLGGSTLRLTLLRSPDSNDTRREVGFYQDTYSVYPHQNTWADVNTAAEAQALNLPLIAYETGVHPGRLGGDFSFVGVDKQNVQVSVVKQSEGDPGDRAHSDYITVRLYETNGAASTPVNLKFAGNIADAYETDLIEVNRNPSAPKPAFSGNTLSTAVTKFELKTFKVKLAPSGYTRDTYAYKQVDLPFGEVGITTKANAGRGAIDTSGYTLPADETPSAITNGGVPFKLGAPDVNNIMRPTGQVIPVGGSGYNSLNFIATACIGTNISGSVDVTLNYGDGTSDTANVKVRNWVDKGMIWNSPFITEPVVALVPYRHTATSDDVEKYNQLYEYSVPVNSAKELRSVSFSSPVTTPTFGKPQVQIFALTASAMPLMTPVDSGAILAPPQPPAKITGVRLTGGNLVQAEVAFTQPVATPRVIASLYDAGGKLLETKVWNDDIQAATTMEYQSVFAASGAYVKVFVWDNYTFAPLCASAMAQDSPPNIALNKPAVANTENSAPQAAIYAVDGSTATKWCSSNIASPTSPAWIYVNLGGAYNIDEWVIKHGGCDTGSSGDGPSTNTKDFSVQVSMDGKTWYYLDKIAGNTDNITDKYCDVVAKYFRLFITSAAQDSYTGNHKARIYEIELYGTPTDAPADYSGMQVATDTPQVQISLSYKKPIKANYWDTAADVPASANDANLATRWSCANQPGGNYPGWIEIDLQDVYALDNIDTFWFETSGRYYGYQIWAKSDVDPNWNRPTTAVRDFAAEGYTLIKDASGNKNNAFTSDVFSSHPAARYIAINVLTGTTSSGGTAPAPSIYDIEVFGKITN